MFRLNNLPSMLPRRELRLLGFQFYRFAHVVNVIVYSLYLAAISVFRPSIHPQNPRVIKTSTISTSNWTITVGTPVSSVTFC